MALNDRQKVFINEYLRDFNATRAAIAAGYSAKTARSIGHENLTKPDIREEIDAIIAERCMGKDEVLIRLADEARGNMGDFWNIPEYGEPSLNLSGERAKDKLHLIKRLKVKRTVRTIKEMEIETIEADIELYDAQAAKTLIGRHHKLFVDRQENTGDVTIRIVEHDDGINGSTTETA